MATADAVEVVDLEDNAPAAAAEVTGAGQVAAARVAEAVQTVAAATTPATAVPGAETARPSAGTGRGQPAATAEPAKKKKKPEAGAESRERARKEAGEPPMPPIRLITPRAVGAPEGASRLIPRLISMNDSADAATRLQRVPTSESANEVRRMNIGSTTDLLIGSLAQAVHGAIGMRDTLSYHMMSHEKALRRADQYRKEAETGAQNYGRLQKESQAREEDLTRQIKEAVDQASRSESRLQLAAANIKVMQGRLDEEGRRCKRAAEETLVAQEGERAAVNRAVAAEKAVAEVAMEKAGAVACANEASSRAEEAEDKAREAESRVKAVELRLKEAELEIKKAELRAQQAETGLSRAVGEYKSSPSFRQEVMEGSLDGYFRGFDECKLRISTALKIEMADLEKIQPEDSDEDDDGEGADGGGEQAGDEEEEAGKGNEEAGKGGEGAGKGGEAGKIGETEKAGGAVKGGEEASQGEP